MEEITELRKEYNKTFEGYGNDKNYIEWLEKSLEMYKKHFHDLLNNYKISTK